MCTMRRVTALATVYATARTRWPEIAIDEQAFQALLVERSAPDTLEVPPCAVELVLARAALSGDAAAVQIFHREMFARVDFVLTRLGLATADADDIKQDIRTKLLVGPNARLAQYRGSGPLAQWVAAVAGREALGHLRKRRPIEELADDDVLDATDDPQLVALKNQHSAEFKQAFQAAVAELPARDRAVLRAMIVDDRSVTEIAAVYGIHRATASRWVSEIRHALLKSTRARLRERLSLDGASLDSAIRLIDSNLDLSLYRLLHA